MPEQEITETKVAEKPVAKSKYVYFKSRIASLKVVYDVGDGIHPQGYKVERFKAYKDTFKGDPIKVGYLETSNKIVIDKCKNDNACEEIEKKEYDKAVKELIVAPIAAA